VKTVPFILRDHREELWRRWSTALEDKVDSDYEQLVGSPLGERMLRNLIEELIASAGAEDYERAGVLKRAEERMTAETEHRMALGFTALDMIVGLHVLRGAIVDVLVDALVRDEMPSFGDCLDQLKVTNAYLDRMVCATMAAR
jgi:hypothetical protein